MRSCISLLLCEFLGVIEKMWVMAVRDGRDLAWTFYEQAFSGMTLVRCKFRSLWRMIEHYVFVKLSDNVCWYAQLARFLQHAALEQRRVVDMSQIYYTSASFRAVLK